MKNYTLTLLTILVMSFAAFPQEKFTKTVKEIEQQKKPFKNSNRYTAIYDKFEDQTVVRCFGFNLISNLVGALQIVAGGTGTQPSMIFLGAGFHFPGDTLKESVEDYFILFDYSGEEWQFLRKSKLIALIDGERVQFGDGEAVHDTTRGGVSERIGFKVTREQLQKLSEAKKVEIKIGNYATPLKPEYMQMFGNVLKLGDVSLKAEAKKKN